MGKRFLLSLVLVTAMAGLGLAAGALGLPWLVAVPVAAFILWKDARKLLTSLEFSSILLAVLALLTLVGTVVYGVPFFGQFWFMTLLGLMGISSFLCLVDQLPRVRRVGYVLVHASIIVILAGGTLRTFLKEEGMVGGYLPHVDQVGLVEGQETDRLEVMEDGEFIRRSERLPFRVRLDDFQVDFYDSTPALFVFVPEQDDPVATLDLDEGGGVTVAGTRIEAVGVRTRTVEPRPGHPAVRTPVAVVRVDGKEGALLPDEPFGNDRVGLVFHQIPGEPRLFTSRVTLLDDHGAELISQDVLVNRPLVYDGWWLYQSNWSRRDLAFSGLHAVHDPGITTAAVGLVLLVFGALAKIRIPRRTKEDAA